VGQIGPKTALLFFKHVFTANLLLMGLVKTFNGRYLSQE
jgi:hypothetical protein